MPLYLQHISDELKTVTIYGKKMTDSDTCSSKLHFSFLSCLNTTVIHCPIEFCYLPRKKSDFHILVMSMYM